MSHSPTPHAGALIEQIGILLSLSTIPHPHPSLFFTLDMFLYFSHCPERCFCSTQDSDCDYTSKSVPQWSSKYSKALPLKQHRVVIATSKIYQSISILKEQFKYATQCLPHSSISITLISELHLLSTSSYWQSSTTFRLQETFLSLNLTNLRPSQKIAIPLL